MFSKAELALIQELREQKAPLERWAKFFPEKTIQELMGSEQQKPIYYLHGKPVYAGGVVHDSVIYRVGEIPSQGFITDPKAYAASRKKGNIYMWDALQDSYLTELANKGCSIDGMIYCLYERFGIKRTLGAIESRLSSLGFILR